MKLTKEMIKFVLGEESSTRNNDQLLYDKARSIYALSDDNIVADSNLLTRVRRDLQRKGLYECTIPEVKKRRGQLKEVYKEEYTPDKHTIQDMALSHVLSRRILADNK